MIGTVPSQFLHIKEINHHENLKLCYAMTLGYERSITPKIITQICVFQSLYFVSCSLCNKLLLDSSLGKIMSD